MQMGISEIDMAILLPACAAAWNLVGGHTSFSDRKSAARVYHSPDGFFAIEAPVGWVQLKLDVSNELAFVSGKISVSVSAVETQAGDTVDQFLELNKAIVRSMCPVAEVLAEGQAKVAGASGAYFTMYCPGARGRTIVRVAAALIRRRLYIFKSAAPSAELYTAQTVINRMEHSFKVGEGLPEIKSMV